MANFIKHFMTITKHRHKVIAHCAKAGILWQGLRHDLSKYSPTEFIPGAGPPPQRIITASFILIEIVLN